MSKKVPTKAQHRNRTSRSTNRYNKKGEKGDRLISIKDEKAKGPAIYHSPVAGRERIQEEGEGAIVDYQGPQNCPQCQI